MRLFAILFSVITTLSNSMFHTTYETTVDASMEQCNQVVDSMIYYLQTNPQLLSERFFAGLGKQDNSDKNVFYLIWKESTYIPEDKYSKLVLDVLVNEKPFLRDIEIESLVTDTIIGNQRDIRVDIHYAGSLLKQAYGTFHVASIGDNTAKMGMDVHVKFGWFFRMFITRKVYSETIDWRLARFVTNLKLRSEGIMVDDAYWENLEGK